MAKRRRVQQREDDYDRVWRIMAEAFQKIAAERVARSAIVPAISDLVTGLALHDAGEVGVCAITLRMQRRVEDWKAGRFPTDDRKTNERWTPLPRTPR